MIQQHGVTDDDHGVAIAFRTLRTWLHHSAYQNQVDTTALTLSFLGKQSVIYEHEAIKVPLRWIEILALLALHPEGLSAEQLILLLYHNPVPAKSLRGQLSKLRKVIPDIGSRPYKLDTAFKADFLEIKKLLEKGKLRAALELYHGPLLPDSDAPGIIELRENLEESLRQAALDSNDIEVLFALSERLGEDLELWEATVQAIPEKHPKRPIARTKYKRLVQTWQ